MNKQGHFYAVSSNDYDDSIILCLGPIITENFFQGVCIHSTYQPDIVGDVKQWPAWIFDKEVQVEIIVKPTTDHAN